MMTSMMRNLSAEYVMGTVTAVLAAEMACYIVLLLMKKTAIVTAAVAAVTAAAAEATGNYKSVWTRVLFRREEFQHSFRVNWNVPQTRSTRLD
jgi:hypothetical protein